MNECSICLNNMDEGTYKKLTCNHIFHTDCLKKLKKMVCPYCRENIDIKKVFNCKYPVCTGAHYVDGLIFDYCPFVKGGYCRFCGGLPL